MSNVVNQVAYLRTTRDFNNDDLSEVLNKSYIDIASAVNNRIIGIFTPNRPSITGESWFLSMNRRQQTLRQVYTFTTTATINHDITGVFPDRFTRCWGTYTDGTNGYGLIFASNIAIPGQISFYVTSTQIIFLVGAGSPTLTSGRIILEWLSSV